MTIVDRSVVETRSHRAEFQKLNYHPPQNTPDWIERENITKPIRPNPRKMQLRPFKQFIVVTNPESFTKWKKARPRIVKKPEKLLSSCQLTMVTTCTNLSNLWESLRACQLKENISNAFQEFHGDLRVREGNEPTPSLMNVQVPVKIWKAYEYVEIFFFFSY